MPNPDGSKTSDEIKNSPPPVSDPNAPSPIGVPSGYVATRAGETPYGPGSHGMEGPGTARSTQQVPARYYEGDDWAPAGLPPERIADLQRAMITAGLIPKTTSIRIGVWDATSRNAYRDLLTLANASGVSAQEALADYGTAQQQGSDKAPLQVRLSNPEDLKQVFRKAVIDTRGEGWDEAKLDGMVAAYQSGEAATQQQAYGQADTGGTVTQMADPATFAAAQVRKEDPQGAQAHDALGYQNEFFQALHGVTGG